METRPGPQSYSVPLVPKEYQDWGQKVPSSCRQLRSCNPLPGLVRPSSCMRGSILLGACKWGLRLVTTTLGLSGLKRRPPMWKLRIPWWTLKNLLECLKGGKEKERGCLARTQTRQAAILGGSMEMLSGCPRGVVLYTMHVKPGPSLRSWKSLRWSKYLRFSHFHILRKGVFWWHSAQKEWVPACGDAIIFLFVEHLFPRKMP